MCNNSNEVCVADILFNNNIFIKKTFGELYKPKSPVLGRLKLLKVFGGSL